MQIRKEYKKVQVMMISDPEQGIVGYAIPDNFWDSIVTKKTVSIITDNSDTGEPITVHLMVRNIESFTWEGGEK
jgi:hypothetical protein